MTTPHKHAEIIKAWADGVPVQFRSKGDTEWIDLDPRSSMVGWYYDYEYRIKPADPVEPPTPLTVQLRDSSDTEDPMYSLYLGRPGDFHWVADFAVRAEAHDYASYLCIKYAAQLCDET